MDDVSSVARHVIGCYSAYGRWADNALDDVAGNRWAALVGGCGARGVRRRAVVGRCRLVQVEPMKAVLKAPGCKRLNLNCDEPLSVFAFKFNLRRYTVRLPARVSGFPRLQRPPVRRGLPGRVDTTWRMRLLLLSLVGDITKDNALVIPNHVCCTNVPAYRQRRLCTGTLVPHEQTVRERVAKPGRRMRRRTGTLQQTVRLRYHGTESVHGRFNWAPSGGLNGGFTLGFRSLDFEI